MRNWTRFALVWGLMMNGTPDAGASGGPTAGDASGTPLFTEWIPAGQRSRLQNLDISFRDHEGRSGVLGDLLDKPALITFFYTRCQNARKCSLAVSRLAILQAQLTAAGLADKVRLLAITYEPQFDTPERINSYATARGLRLDKNALALQLDSDRHQSLVDELLAPVNYNAGWVNTHGLELSLLDGQGRLVRKYHTVLWDNDQVTKDLEHVMAEDEGAPEFPAPDMKSPQLANDLRPAGRLLRP